MVKEENLNEIIFILLDGPKTWNELIERLEVSESTLSRYLKELRNRNEVLKAFDENDDIVYKVNKDNISSSIPDNILSTVENKNRILDALEEKGFFSSGMETSEIEALVKDIKFDDQVSSYIDDTDLLKLTTLKSFIDILLQGMDPLHESHIEVKIQSKASKDDFYTPKEELKKDFIEEN